MKKVIKIKHLTTYLNSCRNSYYNNSKSLISDKEYDDLFDELSALEKETGVIMANSPTQTVGYEVVSKLEKTTHSHPMLSLDKTKSIEDLKRFAGDKECLLMHKLDGLTVLLTYDNGKLVKAETRGNGEIGELITHNAKVFKNIPLKIEYDGHLEVEGEAIITYDDFERINSELGENNKYKNPRNLVSGSVRQLDSAVAAKRHIKFVAWKLPFGMKTYIQGFEFLNNLGFDIVPYYNINNSNIDDIGKCIDSLQRLAKLAKYPIDGMVITYNSNEYGESLGVTSHHPKHSLAYKFYEDEEITKLKRIEWSIGRHGTLTPVGVFEPVELLGTIVERASLHNVSILQKLNLHIGDTVSIIKSNDIIPQIRSKLSSDNNECRKIEIPNFCPFCHGYTEITRYKDTDTLVCTNLNCNGKLIGKLAHFCSKNAMNIEGLSETTLEKFVELGWLNSFEDIYNLYIHKKEMILLDGLGDKSVNKLLSAIEKSRNTTLDRFIYSLSIPLIGRSASKDIAAFCDNNIDTFIDLMSFRIHELSNIDGFGETMRESILHWWLSNRCSTFMEFIRNNFTFENKKVSSIKFTGQTFAITGSLNIFKNREEAIKEIESVGGKVSGSISAKTNYLVNNDVNSTSSKNKKAKELGIPIISEEQLIEMIR